MNSLLITVFCAFRQYDLHSAYTIAKECRIAKYLAEEALERLADMGMIDRFEYGHYALSFGRVAA